MALSDQGEGMAARKDFLYMLSMREGNDYHLGEECSVYKEAGGRVRDNILRGRDDGKCSVRAQRLVLGRAG